MRQRKMLTIHETAQFLLAHARYVILTHRRPDGDTAGSAAAMQPGSAPLRRADYRALLPRIRLVRLR